MNSVQDFYKKDNGVVVNTNSKDYVRAKRRNYIRRKQDEVFKQVDDISNMREELKKLTKAVNHLISKGEK